MLVLRRRFGPTLVAMTLALLLGFGLARGLQATDDMRSQLDLFSQVLYLVQNNYVEPPDNQKLIRGAIDGMLKTLDPHTAYVPEKRAQQMDEQFQGEYSGIGIQFDIRDGALTVISPLEGTPSHRLGIRAGDRIVEIDGQRVPKTITNDDVFRMLRGPAGTTVDVVIEREGETEPIPLTIERAKIPLESVPYAYMIRPGVGYARAIRFSQTTGRELETAVTKLRAQGMRSLVLDLRSNSGGLLTQAVEVLDLFVPRNQRLVYTRGRIATANADYYASERPKLADLPVVVLLDHGSASASEIVAGAFQDLDRGLVVGTNSFGKGLVQNQLRLGDGSKLLLTVAKYYTPSGRLIQRDYEKFTDRAEYAQEAYREDVPSDSALAARPQFKTAGGRMVYGGGGIYPDVLLKEGPPLTATQRDLLQKRVFFEFGTHYIAARRGAKWTPQSFAPGFELAAGEWSDLRGIAGRREVAISDSLWQADRPFMLQQVRAELAAATLGQQERYRILVEDDPQLLGALDLVPRAGELLAQAVEEASGRARTRAADPNNGTAGKPR